MDESLLPEIQEYCKKFDTAAYTTLADKYVVFLMQENQSFRSILEGRDKKIIQLLQENNELKKKLKI